MRLFRWRRRPLTCEQVGALLQHFLDGQFDDRRSELIAEHLEDCRRCGLEADTYLGIKASLASRADLVDDDPVLERLRAFAAELSSRDERG
ncbi:MAG: anti-sigma factor family protein [Acidimicrobiales bacterium]